MTIPPTTTQEDTMKAVTYDTYGTSDVLEIRDVAVPTVTDDGVLVRVHAAAVNPLDWHFLTGTPYLMHVAGAGLFRPKRHIPGVDVAGTVEAVGAGVSELAPGDEAFGWSRGGSLAEYVCVPADQLVPKPAEVTFEQAAAVPVAAFTALQGLRDKGRIRPGQKVLVNGASGGVGTFAVQLATWFGAEVTGVCSPPNVDTVRSLGATRVIDYSREDFTESGERYDVVLDIAGNRSLSECRSVLTPDGTYVLVGGPKGRWLGPLPRLLHALLLSRLVRQRLVSYIAQETRQDLLLLQGLLAAGTLTPVIDRTYPLDDAAAALAYQGAGHARGKIVVTVSGGAS